MPRWTCFWTIQHPRTRTAFADFQWLCCIGLAGVIRLHFLERGHTKNSLDTTFGNCKCQLRLHNDHIPNFTTFITKFRSSTARAYKPSFVLAWRDTCHAMNVRRLQPLWQDGCLPIDSEHEFLVSTRSCLVLQGWGASLQ